jgi:hypothetical protein
MMPMSGKGALTPIFASSAMRCELILWVMVGQSGWVAMNAIGEGVLSGDSCSGRAPKTTRPIGDSAMRPSLAVKRGDASCAITV